MEKWVYPLNSIYCSFQAMERQIAQRDSITSETTLAVQNLDQKNMAVIGDLRGRVARFVSRSSSSVSAKYLELASEVDYLFFSLPVMKQVCTSSLFCVCADWTGEKSSHMHGKWLTVQDELFSAFLTTSGRHV